jgi:O-antigen/teichoic acid export membrane protein
MSEIRATYSGLIIFLTGLITLVSITVSTLIITRTLSQEEYGTWGLILSLFAYGTIVSSFVNFWGVRDTARGKEIGKTSIFSNSIFSIVGVIIFLIISLIVTTQLSLNINLFIAAAILVPIIIIYRTIVSINLGWKPQLVSYGNLISGISYIPFVIVFVYFLELSIYGIIIAISLQHITNIIFLTVFSHQKFREKINFKIFRRWIKFSWVPTYPKLSNMVYSVDIMIFSFITHSVLGIAYYAAAIALTGFIVHAAGFSTPMYSKIVSGDKGEMVNRNLTYMIYFIVPMFCLTIVLAKLGLLTLNPIYQIAVPVVIFCSIRVLLFNLTNILESFLMGKDKVDDDIKSTFSIYVKSKLFVLPTLRLVQYSIYIIILVYVLIIMNDSSSDLELVIYWSCIAAISQIPLSIYLLILTKKEFKIDFEINSIIKYIFSSVISFSALYLLLEKYVNYTTSIYDLIPQMILFAAIGFSLYIFITYIIDKHAKELIKSILAEIK